MSADDSSDDDLFARELEGVEPLKNKARAKLNKPGLSREQQLVRRKNAEQSQQGQGREPLSMHLGQRVGPHDILSFKRPGVQWGVFKKLKQGRYEVDAVLDLHRLSAEQARSEVLQLISDAMRAGLRTVMILHGKGLRDPQSPALLKSYVAMWLPDLDDVMAFHSAQAKHGGVGAVYVLLRKSDAQKQDNRSRHYRQRPQ